MNITKENIIEAISKMNVIDLCDLVKMIEKKFEISANQFNNNSVANVQNSNQIESEKKEEKTEYSVVLTNCGTNKISTIKTVRSITSLGLIEAKKAVENVPFVVKSGISKDQAEILKKQLEDIGAKIELK